MPTFGGSVLCSCGSLADHRPIEPGTPRRQPGVLAEDEMESLRLETLPQSLAAQAELGLLTLVSRCSQPDLNEASMALPDAASHALHMG
jgi:hypothetical protein